MVVFFIGTVYFQPPLPEVLRPLRGLWQIVVFIVSSPYPLRLFYGCLTVV